MNENERAKYFLNKVIDCKNNKKLVSCGDSECIIGCMLRHDLIQHICNKV